MNGADAQELACWTELSNRWSAWVKKGEGLDFSADASGYFERLSHAYFRAALMGHGELLRFAEAMPMAAECWGIVLREFCAQRKNGVRVIEDLFLRALAQAGDSGKAPTIDEAIGWLKKQFELRVRDVVRGWVREQWGPRSLRSRMTSLDRTHDADGEGRDGHAFIGDEAADPSQHAADAELEQLGEELGRGIFNTADAMERTVVYLKSIHLSLAHPTVISSLGRGKSVLFKLEETMRGKVVDGAKRLIDDPADGEGARMIGGSAYRTLRDSCRDWFFSEMLDSGLFELVSERDGPAAASTVGVQTDA